MSLGLGAPWGRLDPDGGWRRFPGKGGAWIDLWPRWPPATVSPPGGAGKEDGWMVLLSLLSALINGKPLHSDCTQQIIYTVHTRTVAAVSSEFLENVHIIILISLKIYLPPPFRVNYSLDSPL